MANVDAIKTALAKAAERSATVAAAAKDLAATIAAERAANQGGANAAR